MLKSMKFARSKMLGFIQRIHARRPQKPPQKPKLPLKSVSFRTVLQAENSTEGSGLRASSPDRDAGLLYGRSPSGGVYPFGPLSPEHVKELEEHGVLQTNPGPQQRISFHRSSKNGLWVLQPA